MKKTKKLLIFILSGIFLLAGCTDAPGEPISRPTGEEAAESAQLSEPAAVNSLSIVYYNGDSLNPLNTQSATNFGIKFLWCDPLIGLDSAQKPVAALAEGWEIRENKVILTLRDGVRFHDGSALAAADVVRTLQYVMGEETSPYHALAADIASVAAKNPKTVEITLKEADFGFLARLGIPIVKNPAEKEEPVGTGKYIPHKEQNRVTLTPNPDWYGTGDFNIGTIELKSFPDREAINFAFSTKAVDLLSKGLSQTEQEGYYGISQEYTYVSRNLVFLSVNTKNPLLTPQVRSCLSGLIDRLRLTGGRIEPAVTPLWPGWWAGSQAQGESPYVTRTQREEALAAAGFSDLDGNGLFDKEDASPLDPFILLANGDNVEKSEIALKIADQLRMMGFSVTMETPGFAEYQRRLAAGEFDFAMVEVALNDSLDISPLVAEGGSGNYGAFLGMKTQLALGRMKEAQTEEEYRRQGQLLQEALAEETPLIPLFFWRGTVSVQQNIRLAPTPVVSDIFANIENW